MADQLRRDVVEYGVTGAVEGERDSELAMLVIPPHVDVTVFGNRHGVARAGRDSRDTDRCQLHHLHGAELVEEARAGASAHVAHALRFFVC